MALNNWDNEKKDELFKYIYSGFTGWLQNLGHKKIYEWQELIKSSNQLEIGIGQAHHIRINGKVPNKYYGLDLNFHNSEINKENFKIKMICGNATSLPFKKSSIDQILAIYLLEHLKDLKGCIKEVRRVLKSNGKFLIALPSEGGFLYKVGRYFTTKRYMERKFDIDYDEIIKNSHINNYPEIQKELLDEFNFEKISFLPFSFLPSYDLNAFVCIQASPKAN